MSESLERLVAELREELTRMEARVRALERREVRFGGSLAGRTRLGEGATSGAAESARVPAQAPASTVIAPPPPPAVTGVLASAARPAAPPPPPVIRGESLAATDPGLRASSPPSAPTIPKAEAEPAAGGDLESRMGLRWVNRIGAVTLILAAAFVFKYAADNGWLGPWARVFIGIAAGAIAVSGAELLARRGHRVVAQGVAGFGIALFYLSLWASFQVFELMPQLAVFGLMAVATLLGGALALRYNAQALAVLAAAGGFLTPILLNTGENRPWALNAYLLLLAAGAVFLAVRKRWRGLAWMAYLGTKTLYWAAVFEDEGREPYHPDLVFGVLYYALFLATPWREIAALAQVSFGFAVLSAGFWAASYGWTWHIVLPLVAGLCVAVYRKRAVEAVAAMFTAHAAAAYGFLLGAMIGADHTVPKDAFGMLTLTAVWAFFAVWALGFWLRLPKALPSTVAGIFAIHSLAFAGTGLALIDAAGWQVTGGFLFALAVVHLPLSLPAVTPLAGEGRYWPVALAARGLAVFFLACAVPLQLHGPLVVVIWAGMGLALAWTSSGQRSLPMEAAAYVLFFAAFVRLTAYDWPRAASDLAPFAHGVFFTAILAGIAMLAAAWPWREKGHRWIAAFGGHLTILSALIVETVRWGERDAPGGSALIFETAVISAILSVYAAALVAAGVAARSRVNRIAGLVLLLVVAVKLYLFDVWLLDTLFRILAFGALGSMLLATSFLYSRLKGAVRSLLNGETAGPAPAAGAELPE